MAMNWSKEVYTLDQIVKKFQLPCVVKVLEGICMDSEIESVAAGDIIKIDKHTKISKVAANFVTSSSSEKWRDSTEGVAKSDIFVPLNYQGKVKILNKLKSYDSIQKLVDDFPRFAVVKRSLVVDKERREELTIPIGTTVQLDRIIPGLRRGTLTEPDKLVILFTLEEKDYTVAVPVNKQGLFQAKADEKEYTLKEVVDRYKLPQVVEFLEKDLKNICLDKLVDVAENVRAFTGSIRLKKVVTQEMLIGHYKPLGVAEAGDDSVSHRTLVLLSLDAQFIRELEVNVLQDATEDDYQKLSFVRDLSKADDEMIYVDFAKPQGIVRLDDTTDYECPSRPPPKPPTSKQGQKGVLQDSDDGEYELPAIPPAKVSPSGAKDADEEVYEELTPVAESRSKSKYSFVRFLKDKYASHKTAQHHKQPPKSPVSTKPFEAFSDETDEDKYDYVDVKPAHISPVHGSTSEKNMPASQRKLPEPPKQVDSISTSNRPSHDKKGVESFQSLSVAKLYERLKTCGMPGFAEKCRRENLDGNFIDTENIDTFKIEPFSLSDFEIKKLKRIKQNWVPH